MPPYVDPALPDPRKRTGLLGGLQSFGGLLGRGLKGAGHNFDRNAIGGIDAALGEEFTPDMRRNLRGNAIMALGQMLATQGKTPIQEGLQRGQQGIYGAWQAGQKRKEDEEAKRLMSSLFAGGAQVSPQTTPSPVPAGAQMMVGNTPMNIPQPTPAKPPDPALTFLSKAEEARRIGNGLIQLKRDAAARPYFDMAKEYEKRAAELNEPMGAPFPAVVNGQRVLMVQTRSGPRQVEGAEPDDELVPVNLGNRIVFRPKHGKTAESLQIEQSPDSAASVGQQQKELKEKVRQFDISDPRDQQRADAAMMGARASLMGAGAAQTNAATNRQRLSIDRSNQGQLGEAAKVTVAETENGVQLLDRLEKAMADSPVKPGTMAGLVTLPVVGQIMGELGINEPAVLKGKMALGKQILAKAMEGGVLRKEDESKYDAMLPNIFDNPTRAAAKLAQFREELRYKLEVFKATQKQYGKGGGNIGGMDGLSSFRLE